MRLTECKRINHLAHPTLSVVHLVAQTPRRHPRAPRMPRPREALAMMMHRHAQGVTLMTGLRCSCAMALRSGRRRAPLPIPQG